MNSVFFPRYLQFAILSAMLSFGGYCSAGDAVDFRRAGLTNQWFTQINVGSRSKIVNMELLVNEDQATRYYLVEYGNTVERISQFDLDAFGKERGIEGAESWANTRKEIVMAQLAVKKRQDITVSVRGITLPRSTIYVANSRGQVVALDADTGEQRWQRSVGSPAQQTAGLGVSKQHVALVNGSSVYCLSADTGKVLWRAQCQTAPTAPPSVGEFDVYVPLNNGRLQVFSIAKSGKFSKTFLSFGTSNTKPLLTSKTVSWTTDKGFFAVAPYRANAVQFRVNTEDQIVGGGADGNNVLLLNTIGGNIFALDESNGSVLWKYGTGDRLASTPFIRKDKVYSISTANRLFCVDINTGLPAAGWERPLEDVSQYVGMSQERIYLLNSTGGLIAIDAESGTLLASVPGSGITTVLPNKYSDRVYIGTNRGGLSCFRENDNTYPIFHADLAETLVNANRSRQKKNKVEVDPFAVDGSDPFAGSDTKDPFADGGSDPFATDKNEDPFGGGSSDEDEDPFGGGDDDEDPFGGGDDDDDEDPFGGGSSAEDEDPFGGT